MDYKLNKIEDTDIFFFGKETDNLLGENLITGTFNQVLSFASQMKNDAVDVGTGDLVDIADPVTELSNIMTSDYYLLQRPDGVFQITRPDGLVPYSLPTNVTLAAKGSLENIFKKIIGITLNY